jgi:hypothetical protein
MSSDSYIILCGRATVQAVSRRLPIAAARVECHVGFVVDKVALEQVFSE